MPLAVTRAEALGILAPMLSTLQEYADRARDVLAAEAWDYLQTGSGEELTAAAAEGAWRRWRLRPHVLRDAAAIDTSVQLEGLGLRLGTPVMVAPTAYHRVFHDEGERACAAGARRAGSLMVLSSRSTTPIEEVASAADGPWWFQVYAMRDRSVTEALVRRARDAGAGALVLTGDTPYVGRKARGGGGRPLRLDTDLATVNVRRHLPPGAEPWSAIEQDAALSPDDIGWLARASELPVLVKGVLRGDDAVECLRAGAAGVVVSNHGGRQLDRAVATADALSEVVDAVGGRAPVLVDGGIRSGTDVLTALALGAAAVLVGRPVVWGLAVDGADGVHAVLQALTEDLTHVMGLAGAPRVGDLERSLVTPS